MTVAIRGSLARPRIPVWLDNPETGKPEGYVLQGAIGAQRDAYLTAMQPRMSRDNSGNPIGIKNFDGMNADLLTKCLYHAVLEDKEPNDEGVVETEILQILKVCTMEEVQKFPAVLQTTLFIEAQKLSGLVKDAAEAAAKNSESDQNGNSGSV